MAASARSFARPLGAGILAGAAAAGLLVAARRYGRDRADQILDWDQVTSIAMRTCAISPPMTDADRLDLRTEYADMLREISTPLADYTGVNLDLTRTDVVAMDRPDWIAKNVANFRELLQPFEELYRDVAGPARFDLPGVTAVGRFALSGELGVLLGYLARRVLGQYDISLLGARNTEPGKLYFVEPNIHAVQRQLGLPHREFRVWLALHEATHAHEFEGHPWVRDYLNATVHEYLSSVVGFLREGKDTLRSFVGRTIDSLWMGGTLIEALMTPEQRQLVSRLQALMCLLEGYSNHVMNAVGSRLLPHFDEIERRFEERARHKTVAEQMFLRATGLQMKMDQYRLGAAFVNQVEGQRGIEFMNRVWRGEENLPSEAEIREPDRWIWRVEAAA